MEIKDADCIYYMDLPPTLQAHVDKELKYLGYDASIKASCSEPGKIYRITRVKTGDFWSENWTKNNNGVWKSVRRTYLNGVFVNENTWIECKCGDWRESSCEAQH